MYQWLVYAHIGSVLAFVLAHVASAAMALRIKAEPSADGIKALVVLSTLSSQAMYPLLILVALTGIWLGVAGSWFGHAWIWGGDRIAGPGGGPDERLGSAIPPAPTGRRLALSTSPWAITVLGLVALGFILWLILFKRF